MGTDVNLTPEQERALDIARELVKAGVPVFVAPPAPDTKIGFKLPSGWETSTPTPDVVNRWRPGWALCAVGGHAVDFLDVDPRNGGTEGYREMVADSALPYSYGRQSTPNGGTHDLIAPLGQGKSTPYRGVDVQGGAPDGTGRGFVFIGPTVRRALDGVERAYAWLVEPKLDERLATDTSGLILARRVAARRSPSTQVSTASTGDLFAQPSTVLTGTGVAADAAEAMAYVTSLAVELAAAPDGRGNPLAASLAFRAGQVVGAGQLAAPTVLAILEGALSGWTWRGPHDRDAMIDTLRRQIAAGAGQPRVWEAAKAAPVVTERTDVAAEDADIDALMAQVLDTDAMDAQPPPEPLIWDLIDLDSETWLISPSGGFKSFVALDWAGHVASGIPWRGKNVAKRRVLYVVAEGAKGITLRKRAWEIQNERRMTDVFFLPIPVQVSDARRWAALIGAAKRLDVGMVIIDTQARVTVGLNENDAGQMGYLTDAVRAMRHATGACVLVVHHIGRDGRNARGSSAIDAAQDSELRVDRPEKKSERAKMTFTISSDKQKDRGEDGEWHCQMEVIKLGPHPTTGQEMTSLALKPYNPFDQPIRPQPEYIENLSDNQRKIVRVLRDFANEDGLTVDQIVSRGKEQGIALNKSSVGTALQPARRLIKDGVVTKIGVKYTLPEHLDAADNIGA